MSGFRWDFRKIFVFLFLIFSFAGKLSAFEIFQFSVAPKYAFQMGQLDEYVIYSNGEKESELNWEIDKMSLLGFNATAAWEMIFLEADCMWGIPKESGRMLDSDWLNKSDYGMKTDYSISDNYIKYLGDLKLKLGVNIKTWDFLHIMPYAGISYFRIKYSAEDGTFWYGDKGYTGLSYDVPYYSDEAKTGSFASGEVITYERENFNYFIGLKIRYNFLTRFTITVDSDISVFSQINSLDHHILVKKYFLDKMQGYFKSFDLGAEFDVKIWQGLSAGLGFNYVYILKTPGNTYVRGESETTYSMPPDGSTAACGGYYYSIQTFVRYSF